MNNIKKAGIITGAVIGGAIGGTLSVIGKVTKKKFIDELGESVVDSTILTGEIAGDIASGATNMISGKIQKSRPRVEKGKGELKAAGTKVVGNFVHNVKTIADNSGEIVEGVKEKDHRKILRGAKTLAKVAAVGAITVGAVKVKPEEENAETENENTEIKEEASKKNEASDKKTE